MSKPIIKKRCHFARLVLTEVIVIGLTIGSAFGFAGCACEKKTADPEKPPVESVLPEDSTSSSESPEPEINITFEEFMQNHADLAFSFANEHVKEQLLDNKTPLSETWGFHANESEELDSISLTYTYASGDTARVLEVANATLTDPVDLDKIVAGETIEVQPQITRQIAFEFDAKTNFFNAELASAVCEKLGIEGEVKYVNEVEDNNENTRTFKIAQQSNNAINVYNVLVAGNTEEEIIENLNYDFNYEFSQTATYPLGDKNSSLYVTEIYELEEFAPENVDEAIKDYSTEISKVLDKYFLESAGKACFGRTFDQSLLTDVVWDIGDGETINQIKMIMHYTTSAQNTYYAVESVTLDNPIAINQLTKNTIDSTFEAALENTTYNQDYIFSFNPEKQNNRDNLVNAIFEAYGMTNECPEGAKRYYIDDGALIDTTLQSEARSFKVVQIENNKVTEFSISIKNSSNDEEFIEKLTDKENYRFYDEKSCIMEGNKIQGTSQNSPGTEEDNEASM